MSSDVRARCLPSKFHSQKQIDKFVKASQEKMNHVFTKVFLVKWIINADRMSIDCRLNSDWLLFEWWLNADRALIEDSTGHQRISQWFVLQLSTHWPISKYLILLWCLWLLIYLLLLLIITASQSTFIHLLQNLPTFASSVPLRFGEVLLLLILIFSQARAFKRYTLRRRECLRNVYCPSLILPSLLLRQCSSVWNVFCI